jgi:hypothetical protein
MCEDGKQCWGRENNKKGAFGANLFSPPTDKVQKKMSVVTASGAKSPTTHGDSEAEGQA